MLETPDGDVIEPQTAGAVPGLAYHAGEGLTFYRMDLPTSVNQQEVPPGTWHAVVGIAEDSEVFNRYLQHIEENDPGGFHVVETNGVEFSLSVHTQSSLGLIASLTQSGQMPGATLNLRAALAQYGIPVGENATVEAVVTRPNGMERTYSLQWTEDGEFTREIPTTESGAHQIRVLARGHTFDGTAFTREQTLTGAV